MSGSESSEDVYDVERIVDDRMVKGKKQYLIKWVGYPESDNTWELKSNLFCTDLLQEYERKKLEEKKKGEKISSPLPKKEQKKSEEVQNVSKSTKKEVRKEDKKDDKKHDKKEDDSVNFVSKNARKEKEPKVVDKSTKSLDYTVNSSRENLNTLQIKNKPLFEQPITNEWDLKIKEVTNVFVKDNLLFVEFVDVNGNQGTCTSQEIKYKAPLKLILFYEENLAFSE